jgi:DNA-binding NarL/FixJ family response regulator
VPVRVVLAEREYLLRTGLIRMLADYDIEVAATVETGPELLAALETHRPDLAVVDGRLPPDLTGDGVRAALAARAVVPGLPVLVFAERPSWPAAAALLTGAGTGYLRRDRVFDEAAFIQPLRRVAAGGTAVDPGLVAGLLAECPRHGPLAALTDEQRQVLELLAQGVPDQAVAALLGVPAETIAADVTGVFGTLGLPVPGPEHRRAAALLGYLDAQRAGRTGPQPSPGGR